MLDDWLLFLGAGASAAPPTSLPLFRPLAAGVLGAMGWRSGQIEGQPAWLHNRYPPFADPDLSAEVLFGALSRFGVQFTHQLAEQFRRSPAGAVHQIAASVLDAGGCVWTTNVDLGVEAACAERELRPPLAGRAADRAPKLLGPLRTAAPGTYVKLHGTAQAPATMAFTDRELMSPLDGADVEHLAALATGRTVVFYGYAGADADLAELIDEVLRRAGRVLWHEPFPWPRHEVGRTFRNSDRVEFRPDLGDDIDVNLLANARLLLQDAREHGAEVDDDAAEALMSAYQLPGPPAIELDAVPGIAQARLVERFGAPDDHLDALRTARLDDLLARRSRTLEGHLRWTVARSLYNAGAMASLVRWLADRPRVLGAVRPLALRDYLITRASGLRLRDDGWEAVQRFADWSVRTRRLPDGRPYPTDLYYRAQARRYQLRPQLAGEDADGAVRGLGSETVTDPERLAGALLESGMAAIYAGRFDDALARGFELQFRRGRYGIQVWRGWGAWLQAIALCHLRRPEEARAELEECERRFLADGRPGLPDDLRTARLLTLRVRLALEQTMQDADEQLLEKARAAQPRGRYRDDLDLILADLAIADGDLGQALERLERVAAAPASPIGAAMAQLGLAELQRLDGEDAAAAERLRILARDCQQRGAAWLELQALLGLQRCDQDADAADIQARWDALRSAIPQASPDDSLAAVAVGEPRVLWLLTV